MSRWTLAACAAALTLLASLSGCFAPTDQAMVRNWRPLGAAGRTLSQLLALSPGVKGVTWESLGGENGATVVRTVVEYAPDRAGTDCGTPATGMAVAARCFLVMDFSVTPAGAVTFFAAKSQTYSALGAMQEAGLDIGVMADLVARAFPLPCAALTVPASSQ